MLSQQILQLVMWVGVIMIIPTFYRFCYAASALVWRKLFPTRTFEFQYRDEESGHSRTITVKLPKGESKQLVSLIDEALQEGRRK
ncbi:hypothetical protein [Dickeya fangzhongdai]|uniref:hypothetical protein n=1 Tax=Dickeya fangzhongdai TaxID=1778540 RepID=UPI001ADB5A92|nr:hypothetical protein [Dickeya fangzhongdai]MBO8132473.1 hypothetical protein [Dickeya fangzhongdai]